MKSPLDCLQCAGFGQSLDSPCCECASAVTLQLKDAQLNRRGALARRQTTPSHRKICHAENGTCPLNILNNANRSW